MITPILDVMQTMPSFAYLAPLVLFFGIGPASAVVTTLIYALPPLARITAHGIRSVSPTTIEAVRSMGASRWQILRTVQLPMARRTIIVGLNQCTMAALSMATIAALINGPGLGQPVAQALQSLDIGNAFVSGIAIVIMAIVLDRTTTAASERSEVATRRGTAERRQPADRADRRRGGRGDRDLPVPARGCSWPSSRTSPTSAPRWPPGSAPSPTGWSARCPGSPARSPTWSATCC